MAGRLSRSSISNTPGQVARDGRKPSRSASGIPISSQITVTGSRYAKSCMNSTADPSAPRSAIASSSSSAIRAIAGSSPATRRAVKARAIRLRILACLGPFRLSIQSMAWTKTGLARQPGKSWSKLSSSETRKPGSRSTALMAS